MSREKNKNISQYNFEVATRLRQSLEPLFGGLNASAEALGMSSENLSQYWTGKSLPGNKLQARLREKKIDTTWIITGIAPDFKRQQKEVEEEIEMKKIYNYLKLKGLDTLDKVKDVYEAYEPMLKVAEKMSTYKKKSKGEIK